MASPAVTLQTALIAALKADSGVSALVGARVYDRGPQDGPFPSISLGPESSEPLDTATLRGRETVWQIDVWSDVPGGAQARSIMAAVSARLDEGALTLTGHALVRGRLVSDRTITEPDGVRTHGVQLFRFITQVST